MWLLLSLLDECFVSWFLFPPWTLRKCSSYELPGRKFSVDLFPWPAQLVCSLEMSAGVGDWDNRINWGKDG